MKNLILLLIVFSLIIVPSFVLASPGLLDQYGGHVCLDDCLRWGNTSEKYHYHDFPVDPVYLSGFYEKTQISPIFYLPTIDPAEVTSKQQSFLGNEMNELLKNPLIDDRFCDGTEIFSGGLYDDLNRARVKPVCLAPESQVLNNPKIEEDSYFIEIPNKVEKEVTKIYHFEYNFANRKVFTSRPDILELVHKIVKGETDKAMYYINRYDKPLTLRQINEVEAKRMFGDNYQSEIVYFDDAIIYSYPIGKAF